MRQLALLALLLTGAATADDEISARVLVEGARASQFGVPDSASAGVITQKELSARPVYRPGEILEAVPGLIVSQHSGEGKANQFFLRGFNLDHGTDLRTTLDDMPLNQRSHAHGQGWTDLNVLIPELVARIDYRKGPYQASAGDFSAAGGADISYANRLARPLAAFSLGAHKDARLLLAGQREDGSRSLLAALEAVGRDGPFTTPMGYRKLNAVLRLSEGFANNGWSLSAMLMRAHWQATDQIPARAVASGQLGRFDAVDPSDGGASSRASLSWRWRRSDDTSSTRLAAYIVRQTLDLYSNFTYFLDDPEQGDQFAQPDRRVTSGFEASQAWHWHGNALRSDVRVGLQAQHDNIFNGLARTAARRTLALLRSDHLREASLGLYADASLRWTNGWRINAGLRADRFQFAAASSARDSLLSPSLSAAYMLNPQHELYLNLGRGFHSNDARAVLQQQAPGLVPARAWELGWRAQPTPAWQASLALYQLALDSELAWLGDAGSTEARPASRRQGVEISQYLQLARGLHLDADLAWARARYQDGSRIAGAVEGVAALALRVDAQGPWSGALRLRWIGPRALSEDNAWRGSTTSSLNGRLSYAFSRRLQLDIEGFNLTNRRANAIEYVYASRLRHEAAAREDLHFHPVEPRSLRVSLVQRF